MKLFEIANQYQALMQEMMECDELSAEQLQALESISDGMEEKAKAVGAFIKNLEADHKAIQEAVIAMQERASKLSKKLDSMKDYLKQNLERCKIKEVKSPWFDIKIKSNPPSVMVIDEKVIPDEYYKEKVTLSLDRTKISQELKNNISIPGVILANNTRLEIR